MATGRRRGLPTLPTSRDVKLRPQRSDADGGDTLDDWRFRLFARHFAHQLRHEETGQTLAYFVHQLYRFGFRNFKMRRPRYPIEQMQLMRFKGERWEMFGPLLEGKLTN